ncbi:MAG: UDP-N-acetylmuramoyl-tripeptide--D-alanyl-D-alanine ligase [Bacillota bacterium]|jgi:UDP-N-acetylmuramoyl-tripeptide--D-alanyl-D-alanine ligase
MINLVYPTFNIYLIIFLLAFFVFFILYNSKKLRHELHMFQLNSYRNERYLRWYTQQKGRVFKKRDFIPAALVLIWLFTVNPFVFAIISFVVYLLLFLSYKKPQQKKPLVMTARAKRLYLLSLILLVVISAVLFATLIFGGHMLLVLVVFLLLGIFTFAPMLLANTLLIPVEKAINNKFLNEAKNIIRSMPFLTSIAVTGSYGKTSCKFILGEVLSEEFMTLVTPASYNTPMGITRVIRENLRSTHEMFVAEIGAKQKGDVAEICQLVNPKVGIITAIGPQHLETFGSLENIINTKFELIDAIPDAGFAVLNFDDENIRKKAAQYKCKIISYGLDAAWDYYADDISYDSQGSSFTIHVANGEEEKFVTLLLGRHNIYNILAAVATAHQLGLSLKQAAKAVKRLQPIPHRLQFLSNPHGFNVIDDAFNSNPQGAAAALEVLACFRAGKKIIVTPGMVELGEKQYQLNKSFAMQAAQVCDYIILVGKKHSQPLQDGLVEVSYPCQQYYVAADLTDASHKLSQIATVGDIVLFENDLPDTYNE